MTTEKLELDTHFLEMILAKNYVKKLEKAGYIAEIRIANHVYEVWSFKKETPEKIRVMSGNVLNGQFLADFTIWKYASGNYFMSVRSYPNSVSEKFYETIDEAVQFLVTQYGDWE